MMAEKVSDLIRGKAALAPADAPYYRAALDRRGLIP
jgi:hypothetical protein